MLELHRDQLVFSFPEVHPEARLQIDFQRTLRIPDDGRTYPLPPGLGRFPLRHVDDHANTVPSQWLEHGGVMLPMYQAEALWLYFHAASVVDQGNYPFALKVATGKIDAVTGKAWSNGLHRGPQDYMVAPRQPWLDGYCVEKGTIRQFVAMPLGEGYTAEEQITGRAEHGGLQIIVYPMKREVFERRFPKRAWDGNTSTDFDPLEYGVHRRSRAAAPEMGLAPGGRMKQEIYADPFDFDDWDLEQSSRCFVHITNSVMWRIITGQNPPTKPPTAKQYTQAGLPWFDYYDDTGKGVQGSGILNQVKSVFALGQEKGEAPLPENASCQPQPPVKLGPKKKPVREGEF
jgi:hypothetical protein